MSTIAYANEVSLKWSKDLPNSLAEIISSPALSEDGVIYYAGLSTLYAINKDGTQKWSFKAGRGILSSPAIADDGTIYIGSWDQSMYAINPDGTKKWSFYTSSEIMVNPAIGKDGVIFFGNDNSTDNLYALYPDGTLNWKTTVGYIASSLAIGKDNILYVMGGDGNAECGLYAVDFYGAIKWYFPFDGYCLNISSSFSIQNSSPAIDSNGVIYIGNKEKLYAIYPHGFLKWTFETGDHISSSPVIDSNGIIYFGSEDKYFFALNSNDGTLKLSYQTNERINSTPIIGIDGVIYIATSKTLYALNSNGTLRWTYNFGEYTYFEELSSPVIDESGTLYIGVDNTFIALNVSSKGIAKSPWPMFCHDPKHTNLATISPDSNPQNPLYNATGTWNYSTSSVNNNCPGETNQSETGTVEINQNNNNNVTLVFNNRVFNGSVDYLTYEISGSYSHNEGTRIDNWILHYSSDSTASGSYFGSWSNGSISCQWTGKIELNKKSNDTSQSDNTPGSNGNGGGCFLSVIKR